MKKALQLYVFLNVHIALVAMGVSFCSSFFLRTEVPNTFHMFIFFSTLCYYNLHWYFPSQNTVFEREIWSAKNKSSHLITCISSGVIAIYLLVLNFNWFSLFVISSLASILYSFFLGKIEALKSQIIKAIYVSVFWVYTLVFIPALVFQLNKNLLEEFFLFAFLTLLYTLLIALSFERRDLIKNEFKISATQINAFVWKFKKLSAELLVLSILICIVLFFVSNLKTAVLSLLLLIFTAFCVSKSISMKNWLFYDLLLDSILLLCALPFLLIFFFK